MSAPKRKADNELPRPNKQSEEWSRLVSERARLLGEVKKALEAQRAVERARQEAADRELAVREELRKVEAEAEDAIAVEEA
ncbi:hypothetical protein LTR70_002438 [Exophiala xenobiotica]|nr:hypothetical protein LTR70_002438 [Exophiala xenobiotica]